MTDYSVAVLRSPFAAPAGAVKPTRDPVLTGANDGVRFLFDLDFSWCYPGGSPTGRAAATAPADDKIVYDIAERANGRYRFNTVFAAPRATYAGGGFDYTDVTHTPFGVQGASDAWDSIYGAANDYFLWVGYYKLASSGDWKPSNGFCPWFDSTASTGTYISNAEALIVTPITPSAGNPRLQFSRQTAVGTISSLTLTPTSDYYGHMCQLAYWRNASGVGCRMKSELAETSAVGAVGSNNSANFSGLRPTWGRATEGNVSLSTEDKAATNIRVYRGWLEDLNVSGRNPLTVLDADWARVIARKTASGGTIFA